MVQRDILKEIREKRGELKRATRDTKDNLITDLSDLDFKVGQTEVENKVNEKRNKLQQARAQIAKLPKDLGDLTAGLEQELINIGYSVQESRAFDSWERVLLFFGQKDKAEKRRIDRLENQRVDETVKQFSNLTFGTINELGEIEKDAEIAAADFSASIQLETNKYEKFQPEYEKFKAKREEVESALKDLQRELEAGTVSASERPEKEKDLDELEKVFHRLHNEENERLIIIKIAQESIDILQKNRTSAMETIKSIHGMRRQLLEKQEAFKSILEHSMTFVRAGAKIERFNANDPAFNKTVHLLTETNVAVAAGAMETLATRLSVASMDPEESIRLSKELNDEMAKFMKNLALIADEVEKGTRLNRAPSEKSKPNGLDKDIRGL